MLSVSWEKVDEQEILAETEAVLEQSGEYLNIQKILNTYKECSDWKIKINDMIRELMENKEPTDITPDEIYSIIHDRAVEIFPQNVSEKLNELLTNFIMEKYPLHLTV